MPEQPGVLASPSDLGVYVRCKRANRKQQTAAGGRKKQNDVLFCVKSQEAQEAR
jgi:hypothetical protein